VGRVLENEKNLLRVSKLTITGIKHSILISKVNLPVTKYIHGSKNILKSNNRLETHQGCHRTQWWFFDRFEIPGTGGSLILQFPNTRNWWFFDPAVSKYPGLAVL